MKFLKLLSILFLTSTFILSCDKEDPDTVGPSIEITNIPDNKEFKFGETIVMKFKFRDQIGMYEYQYKLYAKDYTSDSFDVENHIILDGYVTEFDVAKSIKLPEKGTETYQEGDYIIEVTATDINQNMSKYIKPIKITYPVE